MLKNNLPCEVEGGVHWFVNKTDDSRLLVMFNNSGVARSVEKGEYTLPEGTRKVKQAGSAGSVVDTFITVYINGESQGTKKISRSNYSAITQIELVGTKNEDESISDTPAAAAFSGGETYVGDDTAQ